MSTSSESTSRRHFFQYLAALGWTGVGGSFLSRWDSQSAKAATGRKSSHVISDPENADRKRFGLATEKSPEDIIQDAIDYTKNNGGGRVDLGEGLSFDESRLTVPNNVRLARPQHPQVFEVENITDLHNLSTDAAGSVQVRTPVEKSGIFVSMSEDPFGGGDDGATALKAENGEWWIRQTAMQGEPVLASWFVGDPSGDPATVASELSDALQFAGTENRPLDLQGRTYTYEPALTIPDGTVLTHGTLDVRNRGDYAMAVEVGANCRLEDITIDQRNIDPHGGRGEGFCITGDDVSLERCIGYGERPVQPNNDLGSVFRPLRCEHVTLRKCEAYQASGSGFRPKEPENLRIIGCKSINWQDKGFGYDSNLDDVGSIYIDGFYSESNTDEGSSGGFLIDPAEGSRLSKAVLKNIHVEDGTGHSNGMKLEYVNRIYLNNVYLSPAADAANALKLTNCNEVTIGSMEVYNRFKAESDCLRCRVDYLYSDIGIANSDISVQWTGDGLLRIDYAVMRGNSKQWVRCPSDKSNHPNRAVHIGVADLSTSDASSPFLFTDPNGDYPGDQFRVEKVRWGNNMNPFSDLAPGRNDAIKIQRGGEPDLPEYKTDGDPSSKDLPSTQYIPGGALFRHYDAVSGEVAYWQYDATNDRFLSGPTF